MTCLDFKRDVTDALAAEAAKDSRWIALLNKLPRFVDRITFRNYRVASFLANHHLEKSEASAGVNKPADAGMGGSNAGSVLQYFYRTFENVSTFFGASGVFQAAKRSEQFNQHISRASHLQGFILLALVAVFPLAVFPLCAGFWKVLWYWFAAYAGTLAWTPIWAMVYHLMQSIYMSTEMVEAFGKLSHGPALFAANSIASRMYFMIAAYSWICVIIGPIFTVSVLWFLRPVTGDTEVVTDTQLGNVAQAGAGAVHPGAGVAVGAIKGK